MVSNLSSQKRKVTYPFSKARVYFNAIAGSAALLICVSLLLSYSDILFLICYLLLSAVASFVFLKIKLLLLVRMQDIELEVGETPEESSGDQKWKIVLIAIALGFFLLLPVVSTRFLDPVWWFIGFSGFVTGTSLSEVALYLSVEHS
jgi:hypothetical protein